MNLSLTVILMIFLQIIGLLFVLFIQWYNYEWVFGLSNILERSDGNNNVSIKYLRLLNLSILSPFREEIVCRGLLFLLIYRHVKNNKSNLLL